MNEKIIIAGCEVNCPKAISDELMLRWNNFGLLLEACKYTLQNLNFMIDNREITTSKLNHVQLGESRKLLIAAIDAAEGK